LIHFVNNKFILVCGFTLAIINAHSTTTVQHKDVNTKGRKSF